MWCEHCGAKTKVRVSLCPDNPRWFEVSRAFRDQVDALIEKNKELEIIRVRGRDCEACNAPRTWSVEFRIRSEP